jgi:uncharacterized protein (TIGR02246 family)
MLKNFPKAFAFLLCAIVFAAACGGATPQPAASPAADPAADTAAIGEVRSQFQTAYNAGDATALAALFADDAVSMPDHHASVEGKAAIQQHLSEIFTEYTGNISITPGDTEVSGDMAHEPGTYTLTLTPKGQGNPVMENGKYLVVLKRQGDGSWKIHHDMDNAQTGH